MTVKQNILYKGVWALGFTVKEMAIGIYKTFEVIRKMTKSIDELFKTPKKKEE